MVCGIPYAFKKITPAIIIRNVQRMKGAVDAYVKDKVAIGGITTKLKSMIESKKAM